MRSLDDMVLRSRILAEKIKQRTDQRQRNTIEKNSDKFHFDDHESLAISSKAWNYVIDAKISPIMVFAHPGLIEKHPEISQYYRGMALLSQKQVQGMVANVASWENGSFKHRPTKDKCRDIARLYNLVISSLIEGTSDWTLENGHRNILATMGISLDGFMRNKIGKDAEELIKFRIANWLSDKGLTDNSIDSVEFHLPNDTIMRYGSDRTLKLSEME